MAYWTDDELKQIIKRKYPEFDYVGGYVNSYGKMMLRCCKCNKEFEYNSQITRKSYKSDVRCPYCKVDDLEKQRIKRIEHKRKLYKEDKERKEKARLERLEKKFINRFNDFYGEYFEYICGYDTDKHKRITIKCKGCGNIRTRSRNKIFEGSNISCRECGNNRKGIKINRCAECGKEYIQYSEQQVLCKDCHKRQERIKRNAYQRMREAKALSNGKVDYSISLSKLIERDNGICQLCGRRVDETDYIYNGDTFIAGNDYPSIDHIKPLSKGGVHQWGNVQLAHRLCNSIKCDKEMIEI